MTRDFDIPDYDGLLVARYRLLSLEEMALFSRDHNPGEDDVARNADFLVYACVELLGREDDGTLVSLGDNDRPVKYDEGLDEVLGIEARDVREVVLEVFMGFEMRLMLHAGQVGGWMAEANGFKPEQRRRDER